MHTAEITNFGGAGRFFIDLIVLISAGFWCLKQRSGFLKMVRVKRVLNLLYYVGCDLKKETHLFVTTSETTD